LQNLGREAADVLRNNPEGRALTTRLADLLVQKGWEISAKTSDPEINSLYERYWRTWANSVNADSRRMMTHFQMGRDLIVKAMVEGGALIVPIADSSSQVIEVSRMLMAGSGNAKGLLSQGDSVVCGVQLNAADQPVAYHVSSGPRGTGESFVVPAGTGSDQARLFRCPHVLSTDQTMGEPGLQSVIERLETLDSIIFNGALAYEIAAMMPLVIESDDPAQMRSAMEAAGIDSEQPNKVDANDPNELKIVPGRAIFLPKGAKAGQFKPEHPHTMMDKFVWMMIGLAGADLGLPLVLVSLEFSQVNFHGGRVAMGMAELALHKWRAELTCKFASPSYEQVIANGIRDGVLPFVEGWNAHEVIYPPMPIVDQKSEFEASAFGIERNLTTLSRETRRLGTGDWEELVEQKARERELQMALGVMPEGLPGAKVMGGGGGVSAGESQ
jgi:capsid protein